jgi:hypothetical protein
MRCAVSTMIGWLRMVRAAAIGVVEVASRMMHCVRITSGSPSTKTLNFLCKINELISLNWFVENSIVDHLYSKPGCHKVSKAFSVSKNASPVDILLLKLRVIWSVNFIHWSVILWFAWNPNWLALSKFFLSTCLRNIFRITFPKVTLLWKIG